jgi:hypothetical protein
MLVPARRDATGSREGPSPPEFSANLIVGISPFGLRSGPRAAEGVVVETESLPGETSLEQLRKQAKDLLRAVRAGDATAVAEVDDPWQTALHVAAMNGNTGLAGRLLALGADTGIRDARFDSTPLGWARYFEQQNMIDLLEPITSDQTGTG